MEALESIQVEVDGSNHAGSPLMSIYGIKKTLSSVGEVLTEEEMNELNNFIEQNNLKEDSHFKFKDLCRILAYGYMEWSIVFDNLGNYVLAFSDLFFTFTLVDQIERVKFCNQI